MSEKLSPEADRAAARISDRLATSKRQYLEALFAVVAYAEEAARAGDRVAAELVEKVGTARVRMVSENMDAADLLDAYETSEDR